MVEIYFEWFKGLSGVNPNFNASEGKAMKLIINYFKVLHKEANDGTNEEEEVQKMFIFILKNWHLTDAFLQKQTLS